MAAIPQSPSQEPLNQTTPVFSSRWLVSAPYDLGFFVVSGLLAFVFWGIYAGLIHFAGWQPDGLAILITYFGFTALLDLPHIFQTFARTHADKAEFARRKALYTWGLPLIMLSGLIFPLMGWDPWMIGLAALYGSYHIVRQHMGLVRMYHHLNEPTRALDHKLDIWCFQLALMGLVVYDYVELADEPLTRITVYGQHFGLFPVLPEWVGNLCLGVAALAVCVMVWRQLELLQKGELLNLPKLLLMGSALIVHFFLFVVAAVPFLVAEAIETAPHTLQYHGFMGHYQRRRFTGVKRVTLRWLGLALFYGLVAGTIEVVGYTWGFFYLVFAPLSMLTLFHYYIDGKIWKFSQCPELRCMLTTEQAAEAQPLEPNASSSATIGA